MGYRKMLHKREKESDILVYPCVKKLLTSAQTEKLINDSDSEDKNQLPQPSMYMWTSFDL